MKPPYRLDVEDPIKERYQQPSKGVKVERFDEEIPGALAHRDRHRREIVVSRHDGAIGFGLGVGVCGCGGWFRNLLSALSY